MSTRKGFVIAIDGPDGVGKTTQIGLLKDFLQQKYGEIHVTRASGGTPIGEELRKASLSNHPRPATTDLYIALAMYTALAEDLRRRKTKGEIILIDRSPLSMVAYNAYASELPDKKIGILTPSKNDVLQTCPEVFQAWGIDLLLYLEASQQLINDRRKARRDDNYFENQDDAYHDRVRAGYDKALEFIKSQPELRQKTVSVDASGAKDDIAKDISTLIQNQLTELNKL